MIKNLAAPRPNQALALEFKMLAMRFFPATAAMITSPVSALTDFLGLSSTPVNESELLFPITFLFSLQRLLLAFLFLWFRLRSFLLLLKLFFSASTSASALFRGSIRFPFHFFRLNL